MLLKKHTDGIISIKSDRPCGSLKGHDLNNLVHFNGRDFVIGSANVHVNDFRHLCTIVDNLIDRIKDDKRSIIQIGGLILQQQRTLERKRPATTCIGIKASYSVPCQARAVEIGEKAPFIKRLWTRRQLGDGGIVGVGRNTAKIGRQILFKKGYFLPNEQRPLSSI